MMPCLLSVSSFNVSVAVDALAFIHVSVDPIGKHFLDALKV